MVKTHTVGIGASAGGLEAITRLLGRLRPEWPCAYVVLQHMSPSHRSLMVDILSRETSLAVQQAIDGVALQAGTVYVVPAGHNAMLKGGRLNVVVAAPDVAPKPSINQFFMTLAAEEGEFAIGVVLSGTGSDGVAGLRAIKAAGGFTLAQAPESAKYDGMPLSAIEAGVVDHVLVPEAIAERLPFLLASAVANPLEAPPGLMDTLLARLQDKLHFDFSGYKTSMLMRRIRRREIATGTTDLASYVAWVDSHPGELDVLVRDILISVTAFFRDPTAFAALREHVRELCAAKPLGGEIRVWVAGCATGEEAYSVAILLVDALGPRLSQLRVQVFASDIDEEALSVARRGIYPAPSLVELPPDVVARHFRPVNNAYEVCKHLRDVVVFARHNLVSDPPFLRLDLVTCRNVLIYFDAPLQARVLQAFHFGLLPGGHLFLGRSESVAQADDLYLPVHRRERLYRKAGETLQRRQRQLLDGPKPLVPHGDRHVDWLLSVVIEHFDALAMVCDPDGNILHSVGAVERYLQFPPGKARLRLDDAVLPALRGELVTLLHHASQSGQTQKGRRRKANKTWVRSVVVPRKLGGVDGVLVMVLPDKPAKLSSLDGIDVLEAEGDELAATREHLQSLVAKMATSNEEMQALNEEAQASNEELQATNEELQASNEELVGLNEELNTKTLALSKLTTEYAHLYDALEFPIMVFDRGGHLMRFNAAAAYRFDWRPAVTGQHVLRLFCLPGLDGIAQCLDKVLTNGQREETDLAWDGRAWRLTVTPGTDQSGQVLSVVVALIDVTDITQALSLLAQSQTRLNALMEKTTVLFALKDPTGVYQYANKGFMHTFGLDEKCIGQTDFALLPKPLATAMWNLDMQALREGRLVEGEHVHEASSGRLVLRSVHQTLLDNSGVPVGLIVEAENVTGRKHAEEQLRLAAKVFDQTGEAIFVTDPKGRIQTVNLAFTDITGYSLEEAMGHTPTLLKSGRHGADFYQGLWQGMQDAGHWQGEIWNKRKNGEVYPQWLTVNRVTDDTGAVEHFVAVFTDITQIKVSQREVEYLATHDSLTGLPNRALFQDHLKHALARGRRHNGRVALLFIDLDNFKSINDTLGHDIGDEVLKQAALRLREVVRDTDTIARLGGDEFTAVLSDCDGDTADRVGRRIVDDLSASFQVAGHRLFCSASVGVAFFPDDGTDSAELIKKADAAMYRAKEKGRNRVEFFKAEMQVRLLKQATLTSALREALQKNTLRLVYQPKYSLEDQPRLVGAEALLRWNDPVLGNVSPSEFIPVAESNGLILEVDNRVQELLMAQIRLWLAGQHPCPTVAFNVTPQSIREPYFTARLLQCAQAAGVPSHLLQVEITEGALVESSAAVLNNLDQLKAAGVRVAIDDFGTGYSSLGYLKRLPIHELKVDKGFVDGLGKDRESEAITRAVLVLAQTLDMVTVAEGVETAEQKVWLQAHGCRIGQGYWFSRPLETDAFERLINGQAGDTC